MLFWILACATALIVAGLLAVPMMRADSDAAPDSEIAIYRDQLAEVDRDLARGTLAPDEAGRARTEIARRLLAADRAGAQIARPEAPGRMTRAALALCGLAVVGGTLGAYAWLGAPGLPDQPLGARLEQSEERLAALPPQAVAEAAVADSIGAGRITPPDQIAATVADLRETIANEPEALAELMLLREFEAGTRNWPEAARLTAQINAALGAEAGPAELLFELELMVFATNGVISAEGRDVLSRLTEIAPDHPGTIFYRGLLMSSIGRADLAFDLWRPLVESPAGNAPFSDRARLMIADAAWAAGIDYAPPAATPDLPLDLPTVAGPSADDIATAAERSPEEQRAMAEGMVARLARRLADEGGSAEEWAQLVGTLGVLGEIDRARAIWQEAQVTFADDPGLALIMRAAEAAGVAQ